MLQRAHAIEDHEKALRRRNILDAAKALFLSEPTQLPSVLQISRAAGLAKGTVSASRLF